MSRSARRLAQIKSEVPIQQVLFDYGYKIHMGGQFQEQQFPCDLHGDGQDGKPSARMYPASNQWYCVSKADRVLTGQGWEHLGEVSNLPWIMDGEGIFQTPLAYLDRGVRPCITLHTNAGYEVTVTYDHEVYVVGKGWIPAGDVRVGDPLEIVRPKVPRFSTIREISVEVKDLNERAYKGYPKLNLPVQWSDGLGEFLGYLFGDGWVTFRPQGGSVGITSSAIDAEDARKVFANMQLWSNGRGSEKHRTDHATTPNGNVYQQDQYTFNIGNDGMCEWLRRLGFGKEVAAQDRRLPTSIWDAPEDAIRGFLRGIYATDGSVFRPKGRRGVKVRLYSVSPGFLKDVQLLLLQFGIASHLGSPASTRPGGVYDLRLPTGKDIVRFREFIGFANRRKSEVLDSFVYTSMGTKSFQPTVKEITPRGNLEVADVTMPGDPSFVAGGIRVHNCFACDKSRDAVETVRAKEGIEFMDAMAFIENKYKLPTVPWEDDDRVDTSSANTGSVASILDAKSTFADDRLKLVSLLNMVSETPNLFCVSMDMVLAQWEATDKMTYQVAEKIIGEVPARMVIARLYERLMEALNPKDVA